MQANVAEILTAASEVEGINKATSRVFRESDDYPLLFVGSRELPASNNSTSNTKTSRYNQSHEYVIHVYVESNSGKHGVNENEDYSDYTLAESLGDEFLDQLLPQSEWELVSQEQYEARLGSETVIVNEIILTKFRTKQYGS